MSGTDCRDCLFSDVEICRLQIHKEHPWDHCKEFELKRRKRYGTLTLREIARAIVKCCAPRFEPSRFLVTSQSRFTRYKFLVEK